MRKLYLLVPLFLGTFLLTSCAPPSEGCPDCNVPPGIDVDPIDGNNFVTVNRTRQWRASVGGVVLSPSDVVWTTTRGTITSQGQLTAPGTPSAGIPPAATDWVKVQRTNPNSGPRSGVNEATAPFWAALPPSIQAFSSPTPMPVASGASVVLTFQFSDGDGSLYAGSTLVQAGLTSGGSVTVNPTATTAYTLKVTNKAEDRVTQDFTVSVQP